MRTADSDRLILLLVCAVAAIACGPTAGVTTGTLAADVQDATDVTAGTDSTESGVDVSCVGLAISPQAKTLDGECAFLSQCFKTSQCYCGSKCPDDKMPKCDPSACADNEPKCWCGESCTKDKTICPDYICKTKDILGCESQDSCVFKNDPQPDCGCKQMPGREPDCFCGKCDSGKVMCDANKCESKNPEKCIVVPGEARTGCYCKTCGLVGTKASCFEVECPIPPVP
jgi:hypothetical protein